MYQAILFDKDGVIFDSEPIQFQAHQQALTSIDHQLTKSEYLQYGQSKPPEVFYQKLIPTLSQQQIKTITSLKRDYYEKFFITKASTPNELIELLKELGHVYTLAIVSTAPKESTINELKHQHINPKLFQEIFSGYDTTRNKPFPDPYLHAANVFNIKPQSCLVVEDSVSGVTSGKEAGMTVIGIKHSFNKPQDLIQAGAAVILDTILDIQLYLDQ